MGLKPHVGHDGAGIIIEHCTPGDLVGLGPHLKVQRGVGNIEIEIDVFDLPLVCVVRTLASQFASCPQVLSISNLLTTFTFSLPTPVK